MLIKDILTIGGLITDKRNIQLLYTIHKEFSKDSNYKFSNLLRSMWLVAKDEKIVKFEDKYIVSSFFPPIPSKAFDQVFNSVPGNNTKFYEHITAKRTAPISLFFAVTNRCKYNCWHCSKSKRDQNKDLSLKDIKNTISELQDMGVSILGITGGEPLLRPDIIDIIKSIDERSISILYTTGFGLSLEKAKSLKKAGLFSVGISLDHFEKEKYDHMRGYEGAFENAISAINNCKKAGLYVMIQVVATKEMLNTEELWNMIKKKKKLDVHEVRILETMPTGKILEIDKKQLLTRKEREKLISIHKKANWSGKYPKVATFAHTESKKLFGCGAGTQHSYIDAEGNLYPCDFVPMSFGNIKDNPVAELWGDMNNQIGIPRDFCLLFETYNDIQKYYKGKLPLGKKDSIKTCNKCRKMEKFPGFYEKLRGKK